MTDEVLFDWIIHTKLHLKPRPVEAPGSALEISWIAVHCSFFYLRRCKLISLGDVDSRTAEDIPERAVVIIRVYPCRFADFLSQTRCNAAEMSDPKCKFGMNRKDMYAPMRFIIKINGVGRCYIFDGLVCYMKSHWNGRRVHIITLKLEFVLGQRVQI